MHHLGAILVWGLVGAGLGLLFPRLAGKKTRKEAEKTEQRLKAA